MFSRPVSHSVASRASPAVGGSINGSKSKGKQAWVNNQTSLVGREGGTINVGNTLTNTGSIIGSLNAESPMVINAKEIRGYLASERRSLDLA